MDGSLSSESSKSKLSHDAVMQFVDAVKHEFDLEGSDKMLNRHLDLPGHIGQEWGHSYQYTYACQFIRLYARYIAGESVRVAEVGVQYGRSLRAMRRIIPFAEIYGFDIAPCRNDTAGAKFIVGDGYTEEAWKDVPNDFDLIIDDGSHRVSDMLRGIPVFLNHLKPGGILMIEDIPNIAGAKSVMEQLPGSELVDTRDIGRSKDDLMVVYMKSDK